MATEAAIMPISAPTSWDKRVGKFLELQCVKHPAMEIASRDLHRRYWMWCWEIRRQPLKRNRFNGIVRAHGFDLSANATGDDHMWVGLGFKDPQVNDEPTSEA